MTKIVLDAEAFKALASDTRLQILKALDARPLTVSELSRLLDLNKATVFEHLKQLMAAELVKREDDPARKWVYYRLTWKGKNVLHPENAQIFLMLGVAALGLGGGVLQTAYLTQLWLQTKGASSAATAPAPELQVQRQESNLVADSDQSEMGTAPYGPAGGSAEPQAAGAPASGTPAPTAAGDSVNKSDMTTSDDSVGEADLFRVEAGNEPPTQAASVAESPWWEPLTSQHFLIVLGILVFLGLLALIIWTLYDGQRKERLRMMTRIKSLPLDVNAAEPQRGLAAA